MSFSEFDEDIKTQDAVMRRIEITGEAVKNFTLDFRKKPRYSMEGDFRYARHLDT